MAINDLNNIANYIALDSEFYAHDFISRIITSIEQLLNFPASGRIVPELDDEKTRELIYHNYRIVYKFVNKDIIIVIISHGSYNLNERFNNI